MIRLEFLEIDYLRYFSLKGFLSSEAFIYVLQTAKALEMLKLYFLFSGQFLIRGRSVVFFL